MERQEFANRLSGTLVCPDDADYDRVRAVHNGMIDKRPALIARCQGTADVVEAVRFATQAGLEISVRGGGHNVAGSAVTQGGLMIDLAPMKAVLVDPDKRRAWCQPGVNWGEFNRETQLHGLACTGGVVSTTGVAGLTLGGGVGWLMGRHGLALDNLKSAEVVTADARVVTADEPSHADLFWALRGGGGNFGIVTRFEFELHPVDPMLFGGAVFHPIEAAGDMLRFYRDFTASGLPDDLIVNASLQYNPDGSGQPVAAMVAAHCGQNAEADLAQLRNFGQPLADAFGAISYCDVNTLLDAGTPKGARNYWRSNFTDRLSDPADRATAQRIRCDTFGHESDPVRASPRQDESGRSDGHGFRASANRLQRAAPGAVDGSGSGPENIAWARDSHSALADHLDTGIYSNYMVGDEGMSGIRATYGINLERLRQIKSIYDPDNVFHLNANIPPA